MFVILVMFMYIYLIFIMMLFNESILVFWKRFNGGVVWYLWKKFLRLLVDVFEWDVKVGFWGK